tara:strand:- start:33 stop:950 length:918 start_codon:yes stop_codon:yes gene_type:complete
MQNNKLIGHRDTFKNLLNLYANRSLPNKIMLSGNKGIGKSLLANHFLNFIYSQDEDFKYNKDNYEINLSNKSNILFKNNSHPNIFKIYKKDEKKNIEISQIREMSLFQNKSSFDNKIRTILIDDAEYLNINSSNALLKSLEEPSENILFIIIYNLEKEILDTVKSRCINFKLSLNSTETKLIVNEYFNKNIYDKIPYDFVGPCNSPNFLINFIKFIEDYKINIENISIENFLLEIIKNKYYSKDQFIINNINYFIELFFYKNINHTKKISFKIKEYFYLKLSNIKKYNLDFEPFFLEFEQVLLSE